MDQTNHCMRSLDATNGLIIQTNDHVNMLI